MERNAICSHTAMIKHSLSFMLW